MQNYIIAISLFIWKMNGMIVLYEKNNYIKIISNELLGNKKKLINHFYYN